MMKKKILLINDLASYGKVAMSTMIPVLSYFEYEVYNLPTALVSNSFDYGDFEILETTDYLNKTLAIFEKLNFTFDVICIGFIASKRQAELIYQYCKKQQKQGTMIFLDPIMADHGKLYPGLTKETVAAYQKICSLAHLIVPNISEACFLTDFKIKNTYTKVEIEDIIKKLQVLKVNNIVITSTNVGGKSHTVVKNCNNSIKYINYQPLPVNLPGTGDIFMAIVVAYYLQHGSKLEQCVELAMKKLEYMIFKSMNNLDLNKGIIIEEFLKELRNEKKENKN